MISKNKNNLSEHFGVLIRKVHIRGLLCYPDLVPFILRYFGNIVKDEQQDYGAQLFKTLMLEVFNFQNPDFSDFWQKVLCSWAGVASACIQNVIILFNSVTS